MGLEHGHHRPVGEVQPVERGERIPGGRPPAFDRYRYVGQDAASVAGLVLTSEAMVAEIPEKKPAPAMPSGNGMDF